MVDVKGRWALVTGAARGIGHGAALFMAERGCNLILHGRTKDHCAKVLEEVKALGVEAYVVAAEFSDLSQVEAMLNEIDILGMDVDIVLNNAGIQVAYRNEYLLTPPKDYEQSFKINTIAPMMIMYHFLPLMEKRGFGRIVNTTSGIRLEPQQAGYSASKAALDKVTMDLAAQYEGTDICINITDPGWCRTDLGGSQAPNAPESSLPGVVVGAFIDDKKSGRDFAAGNFTGMTLEEAVAKAEDNFPIYTGSVAYPVKEEEPDDDASVDDTATVDVNAAEEIANTDDLISKKALIELIEKMPAVSGPAVASSDTEVGESDKTDAAAVETNTADNMENDDYDTVRVPYSVNQKHLDPRLADPAHDVHKTIASCPDCGRYIPYGTPYCPHCRSVLEWRS